LDPSFSLERRGGERRFVESKLSTSLARILPLMFAVDIQMSLEALDGGTHGGVGLALKL
jgi:hypothetical protein